MKIEKLEFKIILIIILSIILTLIYPLEWIIHIPNENSRIRFVGFIGSALLAVILVLLILIIAQVENNRMSFIIFPNLRRKIDLRKSLMLQIEKIRSEIEKDIGAENIDGSLDKIRALEKLYQLTLK